MKKKFASILKFSGLSLLSLIVIVGCKQNQKNQYTKESYATNILKEVTTNKNFRKVLFTGNKSQLVVMDIKPGEDIGEENHESVEQIIYLYSGTGKIVLNGVEQPFAKGDIAIFTPGTKHNLINTGKVSLKIFTIYVPPHHTDGTINVTKQDAADENFGKQGNH